MTVNISRFLFLLSCLVSPLFLSAQSDTVAFNQTRLRIWCETARFVYDDNGADSLLASINCQSWETLRTSLKATDASLGVTRLMNNVDKPAIYRGFSTSEARLQKLVGEISTRLKQSTVRRNNATRLSRVDSLEQQLKLLARHAGNPADNIYAEPSSSMATADESYAEEEESTSALYTDEESTTPTTMPWNEVLQWLALLLLGGLLFWRLRDLEQRYDRLKHDFRTLEKQVNNFMIHAANAGPAPASAGSFSKNETRNVVRNELREAKSAPKEAAVSAKVQQQQQPSLQDPAPLVAPDSAASQGPAVHPKLQEDVAIFYDKMPFKGGFHQNEMSRERQRDSLYTIQVVQGQPGEAEYWITEDAEVQRYAMQNGLSFFEEGCDFEEVEENPVRVVNEQTGWLQKEGPVWKIVEKAKVRFE